MSEPTELTTATSEQLIDELASRNEVCVILMSGPKRGHVGSDARSMRFSARGGTFACLGLVEQYAFNIKSSLACNVARAPDQPEGEPS